MKHGSGEQLSIVALLAFSCEIFIDVVQVVGFANVLLIIPIQKFAAVTAESYRCV
jgi:hypothetical protein